MKNIRNFSIIAHIDHGKSTLSDRLIQICGGLTVREMQEQVLDSMDIERERGITIKAQAVTLNYRASDGQDYELNFIDTPGHVDFSYEVSRSLAACEGALLVVDATQGVEAQTLANCYQAVDLSLEVLPVLNKIDLPTADPERVCDEIEDIVGIDAVDAVRCSAKTGVGVEQVLEEIVSKIPAPKGNPDGPLKALIIDSYFDDYMGVVSLVRVVDGSVKVGDKIKIMTTGVSWNVDRVGIYTPKRVDRKELTAGEVGWVVCGIKTIHGAPVGDTITNAKDGAPEPLPGFKKVKPQVYAGLFPVSTDDYENFRDALDKLSLNDASLFFEPEKSKALGFGFRCGFLGLLHMEIVQERLDREFDMDVITTVPNVSYMVYDKQGGVKEVHNPSGLPDLTMIEHIEEPYIKASIITNAQFIGPIMKLCLDKRGELINQEFVTGNRVELHFYIPLGEIVIDFYDKLKSISKGYASFDYYVCGYRPSRLAKLDILLNGEPVDALSTLTHQDNAVAFGRRMCEKLKELIPRQQFDIAIQAAIGAKIVARETVKCVRKDVTAKCYGGDVSRKRKLLEKQKRGKKRMKQIGNVEVPQKAFLAVLKLD